MINPKIARYNRGGGGGGGELPYVAIRGCAMILGTFLGMISDFWVSFWHITGFLRIILFVKFDLLWNDPDFWVLILISD